VSGDFLRSLIAQGEECQDRLLYAVYCLLDEHGDECSCGATDGSLVEEIEAIALKTIPLCRSELEQLADSVDEVANLRAERDRAQARLARRTRTIPKRVREAVLVRDGRHCRYCGRDVGDAAWLDHYEPDGLSTEDNLVTACRTCNLTKGPVRPRALKRRRGMALLGRRPETPPLWEEENSVA